MPIDAERIIELLSTLANDKKMKAVIKQNRRNHFITGGSIIAGGLLGGPFGIFVGAIAGGCIAAAASTKSASVVQVLANMQPEKRERLAEDVRSIMRKVGADDVLALTALMGSSAAVKQDVTNSLTNYLQNEMQMGIKYR